MRKQNLFRHIRNECIGIPPKFPCQYCTVKYRRKEDLLHHMKKKHEGIDGISLSSITRAQALTTSTTTPAAMTTDQILTSRLQMEVTAQQQQQQQHEQLLQKDNKIGSEYLISDSEDLYYQPKWHYGF